MNKFLVAVVGPTAVGKTSFSVQLARYFHTAVLSADSRQVYRELNIGTARPAAEEMQGIPHFLLGTHPIHETFTTADYEKEALDCLGSVYRERDIAVLCGGTGLYVNALCYGLDELPERNEYIREQLDALYKSEGITALQEELKRRDPVHYSKMDIHNPQRLVRALEVCRVTGKPYSEMLSGKGKTRDFQVIKIGLDMEREVLYERINGRVDAMMKKGLLAEAEALLPYRSANALQTVGYKELFEYFDGKVDLETAVEKIKQHSRNYAKRQLTWFRRDPGIQWFHPREEKAVIGYIETKVQDRVRDH